MQTSCHSGGTEIPQSHGVFCSAVVNETSSYMICYICYNGKVLRQYVFEDGDVKPEDCPNALPQWSQR